MGILGKVLSGVEVVAGAALIATGVGVLAGAMLIASGMHGLGLIGGSLGKFMDSGLGKGLMAAVSLGSVAYAMYGASALTAASSEAMAADAEAGATGNVAETSLNAVSSANDAMQTSNSFLNGVGASQDVSAMADPALGNAVTNASTTSLAQNATPAAANMPTGPGAAAEQAADAGLKSTQDLNANPAASVGGGGGGGPGQGPGIGGATKLQAPADSGATGASAPAPATGPSQLTGVSTSADTGNLTKIPAGGNPNMPGYTDPNAPAPAGGMLSKAGDLLNTKGGAATVQGLGSMAGGLGGGIEEKQAMEQQLAAANWGNTQWANQGQADKAVAAAARPISIPNGYLQRAQQVRAMMGSSSGVPQPGGAPSGPVPPQALQGPVANAPASANPSQAVPRGGVI